MTLNQKEIALARSAASKTENQQVRHLAEMLEKDHSQCLESCSISPVRRQKRNCAQLPRPLMPLPDPVPSMWSPRLST